MPRLLLGSRDWVVPKREMCTAFWCGIILVFTSIVLLVTSKHNGRLYQSWGTVLLGCGCCIFLSLIILCIHAYFFMSASDDQRSDESSQCKNYLVAPTSPALNGATKDQLDILMSTNDYIQQQTTDLSQSTSSEDEPPNYNQAVTSLLSSTGPASRCQDNNSCDLIGSTHVTSQQCRVTATGNNVYNTYSLPMTSHNSVTQMHNNVMSLERSLRHHDVIQQHGVSVTRQFGHAGLITVTPLTARRTPAIATVSIATGSTAFSDEALESKATVYDNIVDVNI